MQGTVRLFIQVVDYDPFNSDDHIDDVYVTITRSPSSSFSSRRTYTGSYGISRIELSFRVQCDSNYYGSDCATYCIATDNSNGHYTCGTNGEKVCLSGWSNPSSNCTTGTVYIRCLYDMYTKKLTMMCIYQSTNVMP